MAFLFDTSAFERAHGRFPRGRGSWAFAFDLDGRGASSVRVDDPCVWWAPGSLSFAEARRAAREEGLRRGASSAAVMS